MLVFLRAALTAACLISPATAFAAESILTLTLPDTVPDVAVGRMMTLEDLDRLPQTLIVTATPWHEAPRTYSGPMLRDLLGDALRPDGTVSVRALNDYFSTIPVSDLMRFPVVLATRIDGKPISLREKGPLFIMYPFDADPELRQEIFYARAVWQVSRIEVK